MPQEEKTTKAEIIKRPIEKIGTEIKSAKFGLVASYNESTDKFSFSQESFELKPLLLQENQLLSFFLPSGHNLINITSVIKRLLGQSLYLNSHSLVIRKASYKKSSRQLIDCVR